MLSQPRTSTCHHPIVTRITGPGCIREGESSSSVFCARRAALPERQAGAGNSIATHADRVHHRLDGVTPASIAAWVAAALAASIAASSTLGGWAPEIAERPSKMNVGTPEIPW